jgi:ATP-dependent DNA ligase
LDPSRSIARFIKPMDCLPVEKIPEGDIWSYELKLDGYRLEAVKTGGKVTLYSRRGISWNTGTVESVSAIALPSNLDYLLGTFWKGPGWRSGLPGRLAVAGPASGSSVRIGWSACGISSP